MTIVRTPEPSHGKGIRGSAEAERNLYGRGRNPGAKRLADQHDAEHREKLAAGARFNRAKYGDGERSRD